MLFFLLLCQLFGLPAVLAGMWDFTTGFLMPAAAILSSGLLALWLQRRDHRIQEERRQAEVHEEEKRLLLGKKTALVEEAMRDNFAFTRFAKDQVREHWEEILRVQTIGRHLWEMSDIALAEHIGIWLMMKRDKIFRLFSEGRKPTDEEMSGIIYYVMSINRLLVTWRSGQRDELWFTRDVKRMFDADLEMLEELRHDKEVQEKEDAERMRVARELVESFMSDRASTPDGSGDSPRA